MAAATMARHQAAHRRVPVVRLRVPAVHLPIVVRHLLESRRAVPVLLPVHRVRLHQAQARHLVQAPHQARAAMVLVALRATM